jgi:hypothetical protein
VRRNFPIVFSGSNAVFIFSAASITIPPCVGAGFTQQAVSATVTIVDVNGNIMPAGTTVTFSTNNGTLVSQPTTFTVANSVACLSGAGPAAGFICPASSAVALGSAPLAYQVTVKSDATVDTAGVCTNTTAIGTLNVTVTTPKGIVSTASIPVND